MKPASLRAELLTGHTFARMAVRTSAGASRDRHRDLARAAFAHVLDALSDIRLSAHERADIRQQLVLLNDAIEKIPA